MRFSKKLGVFKKRDLVVENKLDPEGNAFRKMTAGLTVRGP